jgi:hypothetical protein
VTKIKKEPEAIYTSSGEDKLVMFGWCSTRHHDKCVVKFTGHRCKCECHDKENK